MRTHTGRVTRFGPHHLKKFPIRQRTVTKTRSLPSVHEAVGEALPPSVRALCSQMNFGRSKQALPSKKKEPVGPCSGWQRYLHAVFRLIIPNVNMVRLRYATIRQGAVSHLLVSIPCDMTSWGC